MAAGRGRGRGAGAGRRVAVDALEPRRLMCLTHLLGGVGDASSLGPDAVDAVFRPAAELGSAAAASPPLPGLPMLHSLPSAPVAIYLDFNGSPSADTPAKPFAPYGEDSDNTSFSPAEQQAIREGWRQVASYFAPFDVDVTTEYPAGLPTAWVLLSPTAVGGYSRVARVPNAVPQSFVNASQVRTRASGIVHELGHNFGLWHQSDYTATGQLDEEYSGGPDATHVPVMGVDFEGVPPKWAIGHPSIDASGGGAAVLQDDVAVIAGVIKAYEPPGGDGFRADDLGDAFAGAAPLAAQAGGVQAAAGLIERLGDVDAFTFVAPGGYVLLDVNPTYPSMLAPRVEVYGPKGQLLAARDDTDLRDGPNNALGLSLDLPTGQKCYVRVAGHGDYADVGPYDLALRPMAAGWEHTDLGSAHRPGTVSYDPAVGAGGTFTVTGSGAGVSIGGDNGQFAYSPMTGDGEIVARVASMQDPGAGAGGAFAGLDVRETFAGAAPKLVAGVTYSDGPRAFVRTATGSGSQRTSSPAPFAPTWLKLTRTGNALASFRSADGVTWLPMLDTTIPMGQTVYVGLIVNSTLSGALNAATFDDVRVQGAPPPLPVPLLPGPASLSVAPAPTGSAAATALRLTWPDVAGEVGYDVERSVDGVHFATAAALGAGVTAFTDDPGFGAMRYFYRVVPRGAPTIYFDASPVASAVNRPRAVAGLSVTTLSNRRLVLNWRDVSGDAGYRVEASADGIDYPQVAVVGANVPSYTDAVPLPGLRHYYRVTPLSAAGDGATAELFIETKAPAVTGLAFTERAGNRLAMRWDPVVGVSGYRVLRSVDNGSFAALADVPPGDSPAFADGTVAPLHTYAYRVVGYSGLGDGATGTTLTASTPGAIQPPAPWQSADVGPLQVGATGYDPATGAFTVLGGGAGIGRDGSDNFRFAYLPLDGNATITARVESIVRADISAEIGLMLRASLAADAPYVSLVLYGNGDADMTYRAATRGTTRRVRSVAGTAAPYWLRLARTGAGVRGYVSPDGVNWTSLGVAPVALPGTAYVGLAVTSSNVARVTTATFTDVSYAVAPPVAVVGRHVFYNDSAFDGGDPAADGRDDAAVAPEKRALLPGEAVTFANVTSYTKGINGVMIDVAGLPPDTTLAADDFGVSVGGVAGPAPASITVRRGAGEGGSDRVTLVWLDATAVRRQWLHVTLLATADTGLAAPDAFAFGNLPGEAGAANPAGRFLVTSADYAAVRLALGRPAPAASWADFDRDGRVTALDLLTARANLFTSLPAIPLAAPAAAAMAVESGPFWQAGAPLVRVVDEAAGQS